MPSFSAMLKNEITRLSRKEIRAQVEPLRKANSSYRRDIAALKRQIALLQRQIGMLTRVSAKVAEPTAEATQPRFVAKGLRSLRTRLGLSATDFGKLAGASGQSVYNWESGKTVPRKSQVAGLADLRALSKKTAQARLLELNSTAKKKPRASKK